VNLLDVVIVLAVLGAVAHGVASGVAVQVGGYGGFVAGVVVGVQLAGKVAALASGPQAKAMLSLGTVLVLGVGFATLGELLGARIAGVLGRIHLGGVDAVLGGVASALGLLVGVWLVAGALAAAPLGGMGTAIQGSAVINALDSALPPVPDVVARLGRLVDPLGFPNVFAGLEPAPSGSVPGPTDAEIQAAVAHAGRSTVKIEGSGCGGVLEGSGFVAGAGLVITDAHVIAGIANPEVFDQRGAHHATPVLFDPDTDLAVLRVRNLAGPVLSLSVGSVPRATTGAVLGFPGGGPFVAVAGAVRSEYNAEGRNIYGTGLVTRDVYELQTNVQPGNSGGPFVLPDGTVAGVVFARSVNEPGIGYALTTDPVRGDLTRAGHQAGAVSTGTCAAD
jgi:S1-C subfamily serine protease